MSPYEVSASDLYLASGFLGATLAVSSWFVVGLFVLAAILIYTEFGHD